MVSFDGGLQAKSMTSQRNRVTYKMADMCYYGNVMTTTRWRLRVTMKTLWQQQDGGYALLWKRYPNIQITSTFAVEDVYTERVIDVFYIFNSTVIDWTCYLFFIYSENNILTQAVYRQATKNSQRQWQYHMLHVYNCMLLKMSTW